MKAEPLSSLVDDVDQCNPEELGRPRITYLDISSVDNDTKRLIAPQRILVGAAPSRARQLVHADDVLVSTVRPNLNAVALIPVEFDGEIASTGFCVLRPQPKQLCPQYLFYFTQSAAFVAHLTTIATGASYPAVTDNDILDTCIPLPELSEQRRIARQLEQADRLRRTRRYALDLSEDLLPAAFKGLFGDIASRATSFELAAVGDVADRVVVGHVGETAEYYRESGVAFLRTQNVRRMFINREGIRYVTPEFAGRNRKSTLRFGDVVVSRVGANRGMAAVVPADLDGANCANILVVTPGSRLVPQFLAFLINSHQGMTELTGDSVGSAQGVINTRTLQTWRMPLPPLTRQREFAQLVERVDSQRTVQREALRQAEHLFHTLLHRAFSETDSPTAKV